MKKSLFAFMAYLILGFCFAAIASAFAAQPASRLESQHILLLAQVENDSDRLVSEQVQRALKENEALTQASRDVNVETYDGTVILRGSIEGAQAKMMVLKRVRLIPGVLSINDQIQLKAKP